ncbi:MAG: hypothetical protein FWD68_09270 [Alphaproteobacteria bacterium]|nr:hypothetical protein [Alphaproteobacteria bacterium]
MISRSLARSLVICMTFAAALPLSGCNYQSSLTGNSRASQPLSPRLVALMSEKDMDPQSPLLIRLFKTEAELEVWKQTRSGRFALLKTYPICRWSGDLGPKQHEGDRQAPEGFYSITPAQMNPESAYYLSFNTGYPNAYDRSLGHTGSQLMVHGDCSSRGCYAMTDEQIAEIYTLGRESFLGGQTAFQFQAYPFRMTPLNMARHRNNPNMPFWTMIKEGYDHFEVTRQEPRVDFCEHRYVFDADRSGSDPRFEASSACPAYSTDPYIAAAVRGRRQQDAAEYARLVARGTPMARLNSGIDGGMNKVFATRLPGGNTGLSDPDQGLSVTALTRAPGTIPSTVNPPRTSLTAAPAAPETRPPASAAGPASRPQSTGFLSSLSRRLGGGSDDTTSSLAAPSAAAPPPRSTPAPGTTTQSTAAKRPTATAAHVRPASISRVPAARPPAHSARAKPKDKVSRSTAGNDPGTGRASSPSAGRS